MIGYSFFKNQALFWSFLALSDKIKQAKAWALASHKQLLEASPASEKAPHLIDLFTLALAPPSLLWLALNFFSGHLELPTFASLFCPLLVFWGWSHSELLETIVQKETHDLALWNLILKTQRSMESVEEHPNLPQLPEAQKIFATVTSFLTP